METNLNNQDAISNLHRCTCMYIRLKENRVSNFEITCICTFSKPEILETGDSPLYTNRNLVHQVLVKGVSDSFENVLDSHALCGPVSSKAVPLFTPHDTFPRLVDFTVIIFQ